MTRLDDIASENTQTTTPIAPKLIAMRAYQLWEARGKKSGSELENWLDAESQLRDELDEGDWEYVSDLDYSDESAS